MTLEYKKVMRETESQIKIKEKIESILLIGK